MESASRFFGLIPHPDNGEWARFQIRAKLERFSEKGLLARFWIENVADSAIKWPDFAASSTGSELWRSTCFEMFMGLEGEDYIEFNFAPSGAASRFYFTSYRGRAENEGNWGNFEILAPDVRGQALTAIIRGGFLDRVTRLGISAVIENLDGELGYWALAHPEGKPDFHHPACFAATLPAPGA